MKTFLILALIVSIICTGIFTYTLEGTVRIIALICAVCVIIASSLILVQMSGALGANVDITETGPSGLPIIFWRIEQDDRRAVKALIAAGMDIEIKGFQQATPAIAAASANAWITTELLLELGADPRAVDAQGFNLPWLANKARMNPDAPEGRALARVQARLEKEGLMERIYLPAEAEVLFEEGKKL